METITFEAPALYGDHHVSEVRRLIAAVREKFGLQAAA